MARARLQARWRGRLLMLLLALSWAPLAHSEPPLRSEVGLPGTPLLGRDADGRLELFQVNKQGQLRHRWRNEEDGNWSSWASLGDACGPEITVVTGGNGCLTVFGLERRQKRVQFIEQHAPNSLDWSSWVSLGKTARAVAAGRNADGRLEVFALGPGGTVAHAWQTNLAGGWSPWQELGGKLSAGLVAAANQDGRLELFGVEAETQHLLHCFQRRANSSAEWSAWSSLGGSVAPGLSVVCDRHGLLEVFAVNSTNGSVNRLVQSSRGSEQWSVWSNLGGQFLPGLAVGQSASGRLEVFAVARENNELFQKWQPLAEEPDTWSGWASTQQAVQPAPAVAPDEEGNLEIIAAAPGDGDTLHYRCQVSRSSGWLDWSVVGSATTTSYLTRMWQADNGLPDNVVQSMAQTRDGYLWVGTRQGLARFDGLAFTLFDPPSLPKLRNASVTALCAGPDGSLWVGTDGDGLLRLGSTNLTAYAKADGLAGNNIRTLCQRRDGSLWIGTSSGISRFQDGHFTNYQRRDGLLADSVISLYEDREGNLWIATSRGLNCLRTNGTMMALDMPAGIPNEAVRAVCEDKGGRIWIGSNNGVLWYNWSWLFSYNTRHGLSDRFVSALCEDREGNFWVGTYSGLNRFKDGRFYLQRNAEGQPFEKVNALLEDREGNLWVGSNEGLVRLTPRHFTPLTKQQGLTHDNIKAVMEDRQGGLWVGTWGGGVDYLKDEKVTAYTTANGLSSDLVIGLCEGRDGSIWIGQDFDGGLTRLKDGKFTHYGVKDGLVGGGARVIYEDSAGRLWVGSTKGASCLQHGKLRNYTIKDGLAGDVVRAICEDHAGKLWLGTEGGLSCWENGRFTNFTTREGLSDNVIIALYADAANNLWVGTGRGGLNRLHNGRFTAYTQKDGLFTDEIFEILEDEQGWLWLSCARGLCRVRKSTLDGWDAGQIEAIPRIAYDTSDGMESAHCTGAGKPTGCKTREGQLWFPTSKGLVRVDPQALRVNTKPPPVYIDEVIADRVPQWTSFAAITGPLGERALPGGQEPVRIPPGRGEWEFHYTALSYAAPEKLRFKYRLEGADAGWVDAEERRVAYYNNLAPGRYKFHVAACDKDGVWNEAGASLDLLFEPHYWQTWWFRTGLVLAGLGMVGGTPVYVTRRRMQRKWEKARQQHAIEKERARIARDVHDELGSSLTCIMMLGESAEEGLSRQENIETYIRKMVAAARTTVQSLDEIVWAVNPRNDTLEGLGEYICQYANEVFESSPLRCRMELPENLPAVALSAEARHHLFLSVKEAFANILKHAHASEVCVRVAYDAETVLVEITDNGCGFDSGAPRPGRKGNGLGNLSKRVSGLGGECTLRSTPGKGTTVSLRLRVGAHMNIGLPPQPPLR